MKAGRHRQEPACRPSYFHLLTFICKTDLYRITVMKVIYILLPVIVIEINLIVALIRLRNRAEDAVSLTPGVDLYIVVRVRLEGTASVFLDSCGSGSRLCVSGKVPVPCSGRVGGQPHIVTVGTVDDVPAQLLGHTAAFSAGYIFGERCNEHDVGPGTVLCDLPVAVYFERADLCVVHMLVVQIFDSDSVVLTLDVTADIVASVGPGTSQLIIVCPGNFVPCDGAGCERSVVPLHKAVVAGLLHSCFSTCESERAEDENCDQKAGSQTFDCFNHFFSLHRQVNETQTKNLRQVHAARRTQTDMHILNPAF